MIIGKVAKWLNATDLRSVPPGSWVRIPSLLGFFKEFLKIQRAYFFIVSSCSEVVLSQDSYILISSHLVIKIEIKSYRGFDSRQEHVFNIY